MTPPFDEDEELEDPEAESLEDAFEADEEQRAEAAEEEERSKDLSAKLDQLETDSSSLSQGGGGEGTDKLIFATGGGE